MKFHEVDMRGHIWVERTSTGKPSFVSGDTGRLMFVTAGTSANKLFYADNTKWVEIGDQTMLLNHIADVSNTVHGIGDKFSEHKYGSYYNHNLSNTTSAGFLRTLDGEPTHFMDGTGNWAEVDTTASKTVITQAGHGLTFGMLVRHNGTKFVAAKADSIANAEVVGMVSNVIDSGHFELTTHGYVSGNNFKFVTYTGGIPPYTIRTGPVVAGSVYFLNDAAAGYMSTTEPSITGHVSKPLFIATSTTTGYFFNWRGVVIESGAISTVNSVTAGTGITVSPTTGDVVVSNDGVLKITAGDNITISSDGVPAGTGNIIINASDSGSGLGEYIYIYRYTRDGFDDSAYAAGWQNRRFSAAVNTITGATVNTGSSYVALPRGRYSITAVAYIHGSNICKIRLSDGFGNVVYGVNNDADDDMNNICLAGSWSQSVSRIWYIQVWSPHGYAQGHNADAGDGSPEIWFTASILKLGEY